jgi:large subunit ribosomal protein L24
MVPESSKPGKQRKYRYKARLHVRGKFMHSMLSPQLRKQYKRRTIRLVKGDTVEVLRGDYTGTKGNVENVMTKKERIIVKGVSVVASDGTEVPYPVHASNVMITKLNLKDNLRKKKLGEDMSTEETKEKP